ncbi:hypothetical protein NM688_g8076 [Phlebia brevispora]|uniref:Uncharacterized protein n=1 Tax=Phlebia brevispora TaxID=194682 RepID=A0ACC1RXK9_9APHY|nr:hypothetical protein NM688_g8076 [Phlebia brevispora]
MLDWALLAKSSITVCLSWIIYTFLLGVYNLHFHPLSRFPGPKVAAFSYLWKIYVEVIKGESVVEKLFQYHAIYGDIVRIGPDELHFSKPSVYNEIYNAQNRWNKDFYLYRAFADDVSSFTICEYPAAKQRKDILLPLFSRKAIVNMQDLVGQRLDELYDRMIEQCELGEVINVFDAYNCFTMDTITAFCFARSMECLKAPSFRAPMLVAMHDAQKYHPTVKHFPAFRLLMALPESLVTRLNPSMGGMIRDQVRQVLVQPETLQDAPHPIIYHELLDEKHGRKKPTESSLRDEAVLLVAAGTDTVSNASAVGTVHILGNRRIYAKLQDELKAAWPILEERPRYETLESLPYLGAVIKESLRLSHGVISPMGRVVPKGGAVISGAYIPEGTVVGISNCFVHLNGDIFPKPHEFRPERWLEPGAEGLETYLVAFSKGPRSCLGINLGYCELYMLLATLFRKFHMQLEGVHPNDLRWLEYYLPHYIGPPLRVRISPLTE